MDELLNDFVQVDTVKEDLIREYEGKVPNEIISLWKQYGFGSFLNGFLKVVNPNEFKELLTESSQRFHDGIVIFATSMGDLIIWSDGFVRILNFRYGVNDTIMASFEFFFEDLADTEFKEKDLKWLPYPDAVERYGAPEYDECFGYVPLLGLGGAEQVENLKKMKLKEHIQIITHFMGAIL